MNFVSKLALSVTLGIVVAIFTARATAADTESIFYGAPCGDVARMAKGIMDLRQMDYPKRNLERKLVMNPVTAVVLDNAYRFPVMPADRADLANQLSQEYKVMVERMCLNANAI